MDRLSFSACVDAAQIARRKLKPLGNDRARACVRPQSAAQQAPRAGMVIRGSGPNLDPELNDSKPNAGFPDPDQSIIVPLVYRLLSLPDVPLASLSAVMQLLAPPDFYNLAVSSAWPKLPAPFCWQGQ